MNSVDINMCLLYHFLNIDVWKILGKPFQEFKIYQLRLCHPCGELRQLILHQRLHRGGPKDGRTRHDPVPWPSTFCFPTFGHKSMSPNNKCCAKS